MPGERCNLACLLFLAAQLAAASAVLPVGAAQAHATLLATDPADGAFLENAPTAVTLSFDEPVTPVFVHLLDAQGQPVAAAGAPEAADATVRVPLGAPLPQGGYIVSYRVSSADLHPVGGSFLFWIGEESRIEESADPTHGLSARGDAWRLAVIAMRALHLASLFIAAGGALFLVTVYRAGPCSARLRARSLAAGGIAVLTGLVGIGLGGAMLEAVAWSRLLAPETWRFGLQTRTEACLAVSLGGMAVMAAGLVGRRAGWRDALAAVGALTAATAVGCSSGHAATAEPRWLSLAAISVHAAAVAYWLGALWPLATIVRAQPAAEAAAVLRRFSRLAVGLVALLLAAGIVLGLLHIAAVEDLYTTTYGRLLLLKVLLVALLLGVALFNQRQLTPALQRGHGQAARMLRLSIAGEMGMAAAIILITEVLAQTAPPHAGAGAPAAALPIQSGSVRVSAAAQGRTAAIEVTPGRPGPNTVAIELADAAGQPIVALEVTLTLSLPDGGIEPMRRTAVRGEAGRYVAAGPSFPLPGNWTVRIEALISETEKIIFTAQVPIR
jgi:copper transport protein